jgi:hypothetical protein
MHFGPYPYSTLVPIIKKQNFFQYYKEQKQRAFFANAYPKLFFDYFKKNKHRLSVSTLSYTSAGHKLNSATDVRRCRALTAEMTNARWNAKLHYTIPVISPEGAAKRLLHIAAKNTFTLYEFFLTDYLGHGRIALEFEEIYHNLDRFLYTIFTEHGEDITVFLISDHGNLEDVSVKAHTTNPALGMVSGKDAAKQAKKIKSLKDITNGEIYRKLYGGNRHSAISEHTDFTTIHYRGGLCGCFTNSEKAHRTQLGYNTFSYPMYHHHVRSDRLCCAESGSAALPAAREGTARCNRIRHS